MLRKRTAFSLGILVLSCACERTGFDNPTPAISGDAGGDALAGDAGPAGDIDPGILVVQPLVPSLREFLGVVRGSVGGEIVDAIDQACTPADAMQVGRCEHSGARRVHVSTLRSCVPLSMRDDLDVFVWECFERGGEVVFVGSMKTQHRLSEYLTAAGWLTNRVRLSRLGSEIAASAPAVWWPDPVLVAPLPSPIEVSLSVPGIHVVAASGSGCGYTVDTDSVALVVLPGIAVQRSGTCASSALVSASGRHTVWVEGQLDGLAAVSSVLSLTNTSFTITTNVRANVAAGHAIDIDGGASHVLRTVQAGLGGGSCLRVANSTIVDAANVSGIGCMGHGLDFENVSIIAAVGIGGISNSGDAVRIRGANALMAAVFAGDSGGDGLAVVNGQGVIVEGVFTSNNAQNGIDIANGTDVTLVRVQAVANDLSGVSVDRAVGTNVLHSVVAANGTAGMLVDSDETTIAGLVAFNNPIGLHVVGSAGRGQRLRAANIVAAHGDEGIRLDNVVDNEFQGVLKVGDNATADCVVTGTNPGLADGTCAGPPMVFTGVSLASSFVGPVTIDDAANGDDLNGLADSATIGEWLDFEVLERAWLREAPVASPTSRGRCNAMNCRIWDFRLSAADTVLLNRSGDGATQNAPVVLGAQCPGAANGNVVLTDYRSPPNTFLINAYESLTLSPGDMDLLCESNDFCTFAPNLGMYQGGPPNSGPCGFVDGTVHSAFVFGSANNGVP